MNDNVALAAKTAEAQPPAAEAANNTNPQGNAPVAPEEGRRDGKKQKGNRKQRLPQDRRPAIKLERRPSGDNEGAAPKLDDLGRAKRQRPSDQGRRDGTRSNRELARESMINFKPLASHPAEPYRVSLQTEYTQRLFMDHYGRAQISLYNLICFLPIRLRQSRIGSERAELFLEGLEELIDARIADVATRLKDDLARMEKVGKDNGVHAVREYSKPPQDVSLAQLTPQIANMLGMLPLFDRYISHVDSLWLGGYIKTRARETTINNYRNEIVTLIRHLMHLYHESKRLLEKGDGADLVKLLRQPIDAAVLPEQLEGHEEEAARALTGFDGEPSAIAA